MAMGGPGGNWQMMRGFMRDPSVSRQKLKPGTVRRVAAFAKPYKRELRWFLLFVLIDAVLGVIPPRLTGALIDQGLVPKDKRVVLTLAGVVALIAVVDAGIGLVMRWYSARIGEGLIYDLRSAVFSHVQRQPIAFFTRTQTGALISRINSDVIGAQQAFTGTLSGVISNLLTVVLTLVSMLLLSWQITLLALVVAPFFVIPAKLMAPRLQSMTRESYSLNAEMSTTMTERFGVAGALLVKLFGRLPDEEREFRQRARRVADIGIKQAMYVRILFTALTLVAALATAVVYGVGGLLVVSGTVTVGTIVAMTAYLARLYGPLTQLSNVQVDVMTALVSFERVFEVLDLAPSIDDAPDAVSLEVTGPVPVELVDVHFRYPTAAEVSLASLESVAVLDSRPEQQVLQGVSFRAEAGEMVALVGPSGAGKTTITSLLTRMYDVQQGSVRVNGYDVREVTLGSLRSAVGVVTQDAHMFHDSVRANLMYARPEASDTQLWDALDQAQIGDLVRSLPDQLDTVVGERGYRLSGGEKQRLAIARLLLKAPAVVVLDEATAHLDSESEAAVQRALSTALVGRTSIVIAHRLSTVRDADQILVIDDGRVVQRGTHQELLESGGLYSELYLTQFATQEPVEGGHAYAEPVD
ncbi:MAG: ATP-binding cassette, subfamily bacterial [Frankiales bacterium]|nr:ATP-binding cassette, subfamily bacterial [Frankiales bacterium]